MNPDTAGNAALVLLALAAAADTARIVVTRHRRGHR